MWCALLLNSKGDTMEGHKISLTVLYDCYIAQARLLRHLIDELEDSDLFGTRAATYEDEMKGIYYEEEEAISELYLLHDHMLDNAEEISCHLTSGRIDTNKLYDRKEKKYKRR